MLQQDLAQVTVLINFQWQVKTAMESINTLCGAIKAPSALMKINAHLIRRARTMEVCEEAKAMTDIFKEFLATERQNSSQKCLLCERGNKRDSKPKCKWGYQVRTTKSRWTHELADSLKDSVHLLKDVTSADVTSPTPVSLVTSLACLSLLSC